MGVGTFPRQFGKYILLRAFARGGMGELCLAAAGELGGAEKLCLVKRVLESNDRPSAGAGFAQRLFDEAKIAVQLNHPNLVQFFEAGRADGELYLAMELVAGRDLGAVLRRARERKVPLPPELALYIAREMAAGLAFAHAHRNLGLVHRDIAPPNVLIGWHGAVKVTDFGLARSQAQASSTVPGMIYGRVGYLAPEQLQGQTADARADVYSVGVVLWEMLTGEPLVRSTGNAAADVERDQLLDPNRQIAPPSTKRKELPPGVDAVVAAATTQDREARLKNGEELRRELQRTLSAMHAEPDAAQLAAWLNDLFGEEIATEAREHERLVHEDLPAWRSRTGGVTAAVMRPNAPKVVKPAPPPPPSLAHAGGPPPIPTSSPSPQFLTSTEARDAGLRETAAALPTSSAGRRLKSVSPDGTPGGSLATARGPATAPEPIPLEIIAEPTPVAGDSLVGQVVEGRYRVERLIGTGGMGAVYEAEHVDIGKRVALKVLHPQYSSEADLVDRFRREARAASKIGHPNIVDVTDSGTTAAGDVYFIMEKLDGIDLGDVLRHERRLAADRSVLIGTQICRALAAAHAAGIIHRDLKPENIFLVSRDGNADFVKVLDFGIAKHDMGNQNLPRRLTTPGVAMGTPEYMAPEQAAGKPIDGRVDIYAVGAILYELLTGEPPHAGKTAMEVITKKATEAPIPPRQLDPDISEPLEQVVMRCLDRDPDARPQTMGQLEYELTKSMKGRGSAVAAVLGLKSASAHGWESGGTTNTAAPSAAFSSSGSGRHPSRPPGALVNGVHASGDRMLTPSSPAVSAGTPPGVAVEAAGGPEIPPLSALELDRASTPPAMPSVPSPSSSVEGPSTWQRVIGVFAGLAFLAIAAFAAYKFLPFVNGNHVETTHETPVVVANGNNGRPLLTNAPTETPVAPTAVAPEVKMPVAAQNPSPEAVAVTTPTAPVAAANTAEPANPTTTTNPTAPANASPVAPTHPGADVAQLLEWARRTVEGNRLIAPPGDNFKELLGRIAESDPHNREAEELRQKAVSGANHRAALALRKNQLDAAIDGYQAARILAPEQDDNRHGLAHALRLRGAQRLEHRRPIGAQADATASLTLEPADTGGHLLMAEVFLTVGKPDLASVEYQHILEHAPNNKSARKGLFRANQAKAPPKAVRRKKR